MFNLLINLCVFVFIFYAVRWSARMILFGTRRKRQVSHAAVRAHNRRRAKVIKLNVQTTKKPLRKKSSAVIVYAFFLNSYLNTVILRQDARISFLFNQSQWKHYKILRHASG